MLHVHLCLPAPTLSMISALVLTQVQEQIVPGWLGRVRKSKKKCVLELCCHTGCTSKCILYHADKMDLIVELRQKLYLLLYSLKPSFYNIETICIKTQYLNQSFRLARASPLIRTSNYSGRSPKKRLLLFCYTKAHGSMFDVWDVSFSEGKIKI